MKMYQPNNCLCNNAFNLQNIRREVKTLMVEYSGNLKNIKPVIPFFTACRGEKM
jgi:hypothetical protein